MDGAQRAACRLRDMWEASGRQPFKSMDFSRSAGSSRANGEVVSIPRTGEVLKMGSTSGGDPFVVRGRCFFSAHHPQPFTPGSACFQVAIRDMPANVLDLGVPSTAESVSCGVSWTLVEFPLGVSDRFLVRQHCDEADAQAIVVRGSEEK